MVFTLFLKANAAVGLRILSHAYLHSLYDLLHVSLKLCGIAAK
jgi:hypothetical protein